MCKLPSVAIATLTTGRDTMNVDLHEIERIQKTYPGNIVLLAIADASLVRDIIFSACLLVEKALKTFEVDFAGLAGGGLTV